MSANGTLLSLIRSSPLPRSRRRRVTLEIMGIIFIGSTRRAYDRLKLFHHHRQQRRLLTDCVWIPRVDAQKED